MAAPSLDLASATLPVDSAADLLRTTISNHGFVVIRSFLSGLALEEVQKEAARAVAELPGHIPSGHVMYDDAAVPTTLKQIQQLWRHDRYFGLLMERLQKVAEAALGESASPQNMQYFNKPPTGAYAGSATCSSSRPTPPHQDGYYFLLQPPDRAVTMWLALDAADELNGCLRYVLGSASDAAQPRPHGFSGVMGFSQQLLEYGGADEVRELAMRAQPGDLLIHSALLIHRADANASADRPRRAIGAIFYGASAVVDEAEYEARQLRIKQRAATLPGQSASSVGLATAKTGEG